MAFRFDKTYILCAIILALASIRTIAQDINDLRFIGNQTGKSAIGFDEIKDIYRAKYTLWQNKLPVIICLPNSQSAEAKEIYERIYSKSIEEVKKFWLAQVFQGRSRSPQFFNTPEDMISFVSKTPGAIGVLKANASLQIPSVIALQLNSK